MIFSGVNVFHPDSESLIRWGANFRSYTLHGEVWRLMTSCFIHIGVMHLLLNMYVLVFIGLQLEPFLGRTRFLAAYLLTGYVGSFSSLYWHLYGVSAGASGAIFGLFGVFLALLTTNIIEKAARKTLLTSVSVFVVYSLINGMRGGVDNAAHLGGLLSGLIAGYGYYPSLQKPNDRRLKYLTVGLLAALVIIASFIVYIKTW
jgi:rhomboid protease GluP